jgi:hypothetical protein
MSTISLQHSFISKRINQIALKDYKTYVKHYSLRNLKPMSFEEFLKNYSD